MVPGRKMEEAEVQVVVPRAEGRFGTIELGGVRFLPIMAAGQRRAELVRRPGATPVAKMPQIGPFASWKE